MSLIHGSRGLIYFVHEWQPSFNEAALLSDPEMLAAVTRVNRQIQELAPVLNSPTVPALVRVRVDDPEAPVACMVKRHGGSTYVFAVAMRDRKTKARFELAGTSGKTQVEVLGEERILPLSDGSFEDSFGGYDVHLYRLKGR